MQSVHFLPITLSLHEHIPYLSHASDMEPCSLQTQAKNEIIQKAASNGWNSDEFIVVVFHAGLGQELGADLFDPTIYDIHSAYIDEDMISSMISSIGEDQEDNYQSLYDNCHNDQC